MEQNYCLIKENKIYAEIFDELLDEELNMNNPEHNDKIKRWIEKKISLSDYIDISEKFTSRDDILEDVIVNITSVAKNDNLQGNTLMISCDENSIYELFYMEDLTKPIESDKLNEFGSITNIFLQPVCWTCGIFKSSYKQGGLIYPDIITKSDITKLFLQNFYHQGVIFNVDGSMLEIEFSGEDPFKVIGTNFTQSGTVDLFGFSLVPWIEKDKNVEKDSSNININASKLIGSEIFGRVFFSLVCPNTNKKYWDITPNTFKKILSIIDNDEIKNKIQKNVEDAEININPFYYIKKYVV